MDKYEFNIKVEQIKKLVGKSDFETAMKIADTIDWRRVRNVNLLSMISSVYEKNEEYQEAKDILLIAFERAPVGKRLLYKLTQLAVNQGNISEAESYYREFCELAGDDSRQDVLRYLILKAKGAPMEQLIHSLESYTSAELDEKWLYELAELYHQAGMENECVRTCDKIMLMFGLGQYVDKAMELKLQYAPLTKYQMDLVENRDKYEEKLRQVEQKGVGAVAMEPDEYQGQTTRQDEVFYTQPAAGAYAQPDGGVYAQSAAGAYVQPNGGVYAQPAAGTYVQPNENVYAQPVAGAYAPPDGNVYTQPTAGAYVQPNGNVYVQPAAGAYVPSDGGVYAQPVAGAYVQPDGGVYVQPAAGAYVPSDGGVYAQSAASAYAQPAPEPYVQPAPEPYVRQDARSFVQPEADSRDRGQEEPAVKAVSSFRPPEMFGQPGLGLEEPVPAKAEPMPIPVSTRAPEMYGGAGAAVQKVQEEMVSEMSASPAAETYERAKSGVMAEENLVASVREAEVQAGLAEELSKISIENYAEEPVKERTRVLKDVKDLKNMEALSGKTKVMGDIRHIQEVKAAKEQVSASRPKPATEKQTIIPHMMVETRSPEIGLEIALETLKKAHKIMDCRHPAAKISGGKLNQKGLLASASKLAGKDLVIEEAGDLSDKLLGELEQMLKKNDKKMIVMLVDNPRQMNGVCKANPSLASNFKVVTSMKEAEFYLYDMFGLRKNLKKGENVIQIAASASPNPAAGKASVPTSEIREKSQKPAEPVYREQPEQAQAGAARKTTEPVYQEQPTGRKMPADVREEPKRTEEKKGSEPKPVVTIGKAPKKQERPQSVAAVQNQRESDEPVMDLEAFAQCCCEYASQIDCSITGKSMLALYERIEIMEADGIALTRSAAEDLIEEAADKAEKPPIGKRLAGLFSSKYNKDGLLILKEEHFV